MVAIICTLIQRIILISAIFKRHQLHQLTMTTVKTGFYWLEQMKGFFICPIYKETSLFKNNPPSIQFSDNTMGSRLGKEAQSVYLSVCLH